MNEQKLNLHTRASSLACEDVWNALSLLMIAADFFTCGSKMASMPLKSHESPRFATLLGQKT